MTVPTHNNRPPTNIVDQMMDYENGSLTDDQTVEFFAELIQSGTAWQLQGSYGRQAIRLISAGFISKEGEVLKVPSEVDTGPGALTDGSLT